MALFFIYPFLLLHTIIYIIKIYTTEFINYLSLIIGCKVKNKLVQLQLNKKYSFKQVLEYLKSYKKQTFDGVDWRDSKILQYVESIAQKFGI